MGWGGLPEGGDLLVHRPRTLGSKCRIVLNDVPVDAFWSTSLCSEG